MKLPVATVIVCLAVAVGSLPATAGSKDPLFPDLGTSAYDVKKYDVSLRWDEDGGAIAATTRVVARAERRLTSYRFDLSGLTVSAVTVDGEPAAYARVGDKVVITPDTAVPEGARFRTSVTYAGVPEAVIDPDGSLDGWLPTADGAVVLGEPQGAMTWLPSNNRPGDKARLSVAIDVPSTHTGVSNGRNTAVVTEGGRSVWHWDSGDPVAPYLATVAIGRYQRVARSVDGVRYDSFVAPGMPGLQRARRVLPKVVRVLGRWFGPYPFADAGILVDDAGVNYALELQNRPFFPGWLDNRLLVHEMAHQWFGNSVTLTRWDDIWLNEGFATYAEWLWAGRNGGLSPAQRLRRELRTATTWSPAPTQISAAELFDDAVYTRGAMTLQALRERVGTPAFFRILRLWARDNRNGNVTTRDFRRLAERVSGRDLDRLFHDWLVAERRPRGYGR